MIKNIYQKLNIVLISIIGLVVRLILWPWTYHSDITATYWWGRYAAQYSWVGYYDWLNFYEHASPDQPMLNIYYDWLIRQIYTYSYNMFWFLNVNIPLFPSKFMQWYFDFGNQYLLKIPMILVDITVIYCIYRFTKSKILALIISIYPPLILNSSIWGSGDIIVTFFALISIYQVWTKKYSLSAIFYIISVLYKPSLLIWLPIIGIISIKNKISISQLIKTILVSLIFIYIICQPFVPENINALLWFYKIMSTQILPGVLNYTSVNAMNFWYLITPGINPTLDTKLIFNLINFRTISLIICGLLYTFTLLKLYKKYNHFQLLLTMVNITLITFTFMTRMHERYTFPALIPLLILCQSDSRLIKYFITLSITHIINVISAWWYPSINIQLVQLISLINITITLKLIFFNLKVHPTDQKHNYPQPPYRKQLTQKN